MIPLKPKTGWQSIHLNNISESTIAFNLFFQSLICCFFNHLMVIKKSIACWFI